jgi:AGCS family alanine or glycine:cation symporter
VVRDFDGIRVQVVQRAGELIGIVPEQAVALPRYGVFPLPEGYPASENAEHLVVTGTSEAPFPVRIDVARSVILSTEFTVPDGALPIAAGMRVRQGDHLFDVLDASTDTLQLRSTATRTDPGKLPNPDNHQFPIVVLWLICGALFFTLRMQFVNVWAFGHAIKVTAGAYDDPDDPGEIPHFKALTSALSATVGLGNIAGVAIAIGMGGPGAIFWMVCAGFLGMTSKFTECTLGQLYRVERPDGSISGGPMHYLDVGLKEMGFGRFGKLLAILFALLCIGGSFGGGNMFQANQSYAAVQDVVPLLEGRAWLYGLIMAGLVALVIIGGIRRIGTATSLIVPFMCGIYVLAGLWILFANAELVPEALRTIFREAFTPSAAYGGFIGTLVQGFRRAAFSNEAGVGSASIAHSAASTKYGVREGIVALLEPFIDTIVVCTMTGLVVVVTGAYLDVGEGTFSQGVVMTSRAFATVIEWFPVVLSIAVMLFAYSTMISWSYYGERCATWLFGGRATIPYRIVFLFFVFFGAVFKLGHVLDFSDLMILGMAFPNIFGAVLLSGKVKRALDDYWARHKAGEFKAKRRKAA